MPKFRKLLKNKNFVLYSIGQAFSQFGDRLVQIVLIGFVYKRWPGSTFQLAKLFFFTVVPSFFISPIAGVYIDRWNKKYVMVLSDLFRAIFILLIPLFFIYRESIVPIYIVIFFVFLFACFFLPARFSIIPNIVSKEELLLANSASSITWVVAGIMGFSFGAVLVEWLGIKNSLYINSLVYLCSAISFLFLPTLHHVKIVLQESFFQDLIKGLRTLLFDRQIRFVVAIFFILSSMAGAIWVVCIVFIQETLQSMTKYVGLLGLWLFSGILIGSYVYGKIGQTFSRTRTIFTSFFLTGIFINIFAIGLKITESFWFGSVSVFLLGFFISPIYVTANTIIHETIVSDLGGRIFSSIGIVMNFGFILFMFISSLFAEYIDRVWILSISGSAVIIFGIISMLVGFLKRATFSSS